MTQIDAGESSEFEVAMDRADIFRSAYVLVTSLDWGEYQIDVADVATVARFLTNDF